MKERRTEGISLFRTRIGPLISALGGALALIGLWAPLFFTAPPINPTNPNPYPPVVNGWQTLGFLHVYWSEAYLSLTRVAPEILLWLLLGGIILGASLLALLREDSLLAARARSLAASASIAVLCGFYLSSVFLNWASSPDGAAASPLIDAGPARWLLLVSTVLSAIGAGGVSIGATFGAFCGIVVGSFALPYGIVIGSWVLPYAPQPSDRFVSLTGIFLGLVFVSLAVLGCLLGGWRFLRKQTRLHRVRAVSKQADDALISNSSRNER